MMKMMRLKNYFMMMTNKIVNEMIQTKKKEENPWDENHCYFCITTFNSYKEKKKNRVAENETKNLWWESAIRFDIQ